VTLSPFAALILDWVITALWPLIGRAGMTHFSGVLFATAGLVVGGCLVAPFLLAEGRWRLLLERRTAAALAAMGFFSGLASVIFISALEFTTPANAAIMAQIEVIYSALLCAYLLGERISGKQAFASGLVIAGTGLIMIHDLKSPRWKGDLMILVTPWMYQLSHVFSKKLPRELDAYAITGGRIVYGVLTMLPFCAWSLAHGGRWSVSAPALTLLLAQGALMSSGNFVLWYRAIRGMDLSKATAIMLSYPALTVVFSWALGSERIEAVQVAGLLVTLTGAYWVSRLVLEAQKGAPPARTLVAETPGTDLVP
jgi:drug/metabolite transporter (DMT)-like permease